MTGLLQIHFQLRQCKKY